MSSLAISLNLSQKEIDDVALEGVSLASVLGLPIEEYLVKQVKSRVNTLAEAFDIKKLPILLCDDGRCSWAA